jgi:hypothetical protein
MTDQQLLDDLLELERAGWRSLCESTGDRFYGDLMTDDALMVLAIGAVMDRDAVTAALGQAPPWRSFELSNARIVRAGPDTAALVDTSARPNATAPANRSSARCRRFITAPVTAGAWCCISRRHSANR